jgi:hypothetical protein
MYLERNSIIKIIIITIAPSIAKFLTKTTMHHALWNRPDTAYSTPGHGQLGRASQAYVRW